MSLNPGYREQQLLAGARERQTTRLSRRERHAQAVSVGVYAFVTLALALLVGVHLDGVRPWAVASCMLALAVAWATEFDTDTGVTVPTQLAFVPLLFALPLRSCRSPCRWPLPAPSSRTCSAGELRPGAAARRRPRTPGS